MIFHKIQHEDKDKTTQWFLELDGKEGKHGDLAAIVNYAFSVYSGWEFPNAMNSLLWHDGNISMFITFLHEWVRSLLDANSKRFLMQENCSFFPVMKDDVNIIETKEIKLLGDHDRIKNGFNIVNPKINNDKPRYIQWENGKHWYCKVGNVDVVVNGIQKWNSKRDAEKAYKKWEK